MRHCRQDAVTSPPESGAPGALPVTPETRNSEGGGTESKKGCRGPLVTSVTLNDVIAVGDPESCNRRARAKSVSAHQALSLVLCAQKHSSFLSSATPWEEAVADAGIAVRRGRGGGSFLVWLWGRGGWPL